MTKHIFLLIVCAVPFLSMTNPESCELQVKVTGLDNLDGDLMVGLYDDPNLFPNKPITGSKVTLNGNAYTIINFENLKPGKYAISIFHDKNSNGKLDTNMLGIPTEKFAFGNNAKGYFGPPPFDRASLQLVVGETGYTIINF